MRDGPPPDGLLRDGEVRQRLMRSKELREGKDA